MKCYVWKLLSAKRKNIVSGRKKPNEFAYLATNRESEKWTHSCFVGPNREKIAPITSPFV